MCETTAVTFLPEKVKTKEKLDAAINMITFDHNNFKITKDKSGVLSYRIIKENSALIKRALTTTLDVKIALLICVLRSTMT